MAKPELIKAISKHLTKKHNTQFASKNYSLSPSVAGDPCMRKKYYSYFKVPQKDKWIGQILTLEGGIGTHENIQGWLGDMGIAVDYLDPKTGKPPIGKYTGKPDIEFPIAIEDLKIQKGKIDRVIVQDNEIWLVEIKSVGDDKFQNIMKPQEDHIVQGTLYVFGFELCLQRGDYDHIPQINKNMPVMGIIYLYVSRDNGKMKEYVVPRDEKKFMKICEDIEILSHYIDAKKLPPPPAPGVCKFCPYPDWCKNNKNIR